MKNQFTKYNLIYLYAKKVMRLQIILKKIII